jgi:hypothetical protein
MRLSLDGDSLLGNLADNSLPRDNAHDGSLSEAVTAPAYLPRDKARRIRSWR